MKKTVLITAGFLLILFISAAIYFASDDFRMKTDKYHFDKVVHTFAGFLIATSAALLFGVRRLWLFLLFSLFIGGGWEIFESFVLDPILIKFYKETITFGMADMVGDMVADIFGSCIYWFVFVKRLFF